MSGHGTGIDGGRFGARFHIGERGKSVSFLFQI